MKTILMSIFSGKVRSGLISGSSKKLQHVQLKLKTSVEGLVFSSMFDTRLKLISIGPGQYFFRLEPVWELTVAVAGVQIPMLLRGQRASVEPGPPLVVAEWVLEYSYSKPRHAQVSMDLQSWITQFKP